MRGPVTKPTLAFAGVSRTRRFAVTGASSVTVGALRIRSPDVVMDPDELEEMVADTVWHEIAHYFGMDEARVRRAERKRGVR